MKNGKSLNGVLKVQIPEEKDIVEVDYHPYLSIEESVLPVVVNALSGERRILEFFETIHSFFGVMFFFKGLFLNNIGLGMERNVGGEMEVVNFKVPEDGSGCVSTYFPTDLCSFGGSALGAAESLYAIMSGGGLLISFRNGMETCSYSVLGEVPSFSSVGELAMKLRLSGM